MYYFHDILLNSPKGKAIGLSYFKERGYSNEIIKKFELGYALDEWNVFTEEALTKGYQLEFLEKTGLTIVKKNKQFDRFKGRIIFPIHSMSGRVLGFGGRILTSEKKAAKYVNSPESEIYHKSKVLYGIYHAKQSIAKEDNCYLVEGYTDVISLYQAGIHNVVASSGTALTPDQIRLVNRLTPNITVLFDGDAAGIRASLRGIDLILEQGMNVRVVTFPEGEDPDSFAKQNSSEELLDYLENNAQDFIRFKVSTLMNEVQNDPVKKAGLIRDIVVSIYDGKMHPVDSNEISFKLAGRNAFNIAFKNAGAKILEPIYDLDVWTPSDRMGDVMSDLQGRRGMIEGMSNEGRYEKIKAKVGVKRSHFYLFCSSTNCS